MPIYNYKCRICDKEMEISQKIDDDYKPSCEHEDHEGHPMFIPMTRQISKTAFALKGSGWARDKYGSGKK